MLAILDREAVSNASIVDGQLATLDGLIERVVSSEEVFLKPANRLVHVEENSLNIYCIYK